MKRLNKIIYKDWDFLYEKCATENGQVNRNSFEYERWDYISDAIMHHSQLSVTLQNIERLIKIQCRKFFNQQP